MLDPVSSTSCRTPLLESLEPRLLLDAAGGEQALQLFSTSPAVFAENRGQSSGQTVLATDLVPSSGSDGAVVAEAGVRSHMAETSSSDIPLELVGHWGGFARAVTVGGDYAYLCQGRRLIILDIADPAAPRELGAALLEKEGTAVAASGNLAYAVDGEGLKIIDTSDPAAPVRVGGYDTSGEAMDVFVSGDLAYVADQDAGLQIIDVSNPTAPVRVAGYDTDGSAFGVTVSDNVAYLADSDAGLQIIDVSDPATPLHLGGCETPGFASDVFVSGDLAYVADGNLQIIDVFDLSGPVRIGGWDTSDWTGNVFVSGNLVYNTSGSAGLDIIDVLDPFAPLLVGAYDTAGAAVDVFLSGDFAYVADWKEGLQIIDVSDPAAPAPQSEYRTTSGARDVVVSDNLAYVANWEGLQIIDVTDPDVPVRLGGCKTSGSAWGVFLSGNLAYVSDADTGLYIIDVSDPTAPVAIGEYEMGHGLFAVFVSGNLAYIVDGNGGLEIIDVSDPAAPVRVGDYIPSGWATDVFVSGDLAYLACIPHAGSDGLQIVDVSDPTAPAARGGFAGGVFEDVFVSGDRAYMACSGVHIFDVSNPSAPVRIGRYDTHHWTEELFVSGGLAYIADRDGGLQIVDVSNPAAPVWRSGYATTDSTLDVFVSGGLAYVADGQGGLVILQVGDSALQQWVYNSAFLTDAQMEQYAPMNEEQVRAFLMAQGSYFRQPVADADGVVFDMASVIVDAASQYEINPKVLLATLEKESAAVTTPTRPTETRMRLLMGAGAASTAREQVQEAARLYRAYLDELDADGMTRSGWQVGVGKTTLDGVRVVPATRAVAALFTYTPYAGAQWGGNQPQWGGTYLFHHYWDAFAFDSEVPSLPAPTGLMATAASDSEIALRWDAVPDAGGYRLERRAETSGAWAGLATLGAMTDYQDTGLSTDSQYYYRLAAYCDEGASPWSRTVNGSPLYATMPWTTGVEPVTPEPTGRPQPFTVYGQNLDPSATVTLIHLDSGTEYTNREVTDRDPGGRWITINPNFGIAAAEWAIVVTNPDGQSSEHYFTVRAKPASEAGTGSHVTIDQARFVQALGDRGYVTGAETLGQVIGLDETRNYTEAEKDQVNDRAELVDYDWEKQEEGIGQLLTFIQNDPHLDLTRDQHIRWAAYMLATAYHETRYTWNPVQEGYNSPAWEYFEGHYAGVNGNGAYGTGDGFRYRGRGYAQLTGKEPYTRFGEAFDVDFAGDPNEVLEPTNAYGVMSYGMRHGLFTQSLQGLDHYISDGAGLSEGERFNEYVASREIVNPGDKPVEIAQYAVAIEAMLREALSDAPGPDTGKTYYVRDGALTGASLASWSAAGDGTADGELEGARLTTASPITLYQAITTPSKTFDVEFDYWFQTTSGTLDVLLDSVVLGAVNAPETLDGEPCPFSVTVTDSTLWDLEDARLAFRFDGPADSQVLLSNVTIEPADTGMAVPEVGGHLVAGGLDQRSAVGEVGASFSGDVSGSLLTDNLLLENLDTGQTIQADLLALDYDAASNTATWTFPGLAEGLLPEGNYRATVLAEGLADTTGTPVIDDHSFEFHVLKGDATGDVKTNIFDLLKVRQNYLKPADDPDRDDNADVTGDGSVNIFDLLMVRQNYLRALEAPAGGASAATVLAAETSPEPLARPGEVAAMMDSAELSMLRPKADGPNPRPEADSASPTGGNLATDGGLHAAEDRTQARDRTVAASGEPTASVPPLPPVSGHEPTTSEAVPAEDGLVDALAVPALAVMLDS